MTVPAQTTYTQATGNGVTTAFPFGFLALRSDEVLVSLDGVPLANGAGYSISGIGVVSGGTINFSFPPATGVVVLIQRNMQLSRSTDYQYQGQLPSSTVNADFDRIWMVLQQIGVFNLSAVRAPFPEQIPALPRAATRAGKLLGFDPLGNPVPVVPNDQSVGSYALTLLSLVGSSLIGFTQGGVGAAYRTVQDQLRDQVNVKQFGAKGDGVTDDSLAIMRADAYAASISAELVFPSGAYRASGLSASTDWRGLGRRVRIWNNDRSGTSPFGFMEISSKSNILMTNLTFDGWVTDDPVAWNSTNYNSFQGRIACAVLSSEGVHFDRCIFQNSFFSPLRVEGSNNCTFTGCRMTRGRGNFGDACYVNNSFNIDFVNCEAFDFTRIGFVTEAGSRRVTYTACRANYGHDASRLYTGGEFNAGFWNENSSDVLHINGNSTNCGDRGFYCATGPSTAPSFVSAGYGLVNCLSLQNTTGFLCQSISTRPIEAVLMNCKAYGSTVSYLMSASNDTDSFTEIGCHSEIAMSAGATNSASFVFANLAPSGTNYPLFTHRDCTITHTAFDQATIDSASTNTADISCLASAGRCRAVFANVRNTDSTKPVSVKQRTSTLPLIRYEFANSYLYPAQIVRCEAFTASNCQFADFTAGILHSGPLVFDACSAGRGLINGLAGSTQRFNDVTYAPGQFAFTVFNASDSKEPAVFFTGGSLRKDIAANDYGIQVQCEGATNKPVVLFNGMSFYNTGGATATNVFIWIVRAGTGDNYAGCFSDANVTNLRRIVSTGSNPATGNTPITMH